MAIHVVTEGHWQKLLTAMGREDLKGDPRFASMRDRATNMEATEAVVIAWTSSLSKAEVFAATRLHRIPCAPVRTAPEVMNDPHMHARGMLERIVHPELGEIVVPTTPLRLHGAEKVATVPSPAVGAQNDEVYGGWLGIGAGEIAALRADGVI